MEQSQNCGAPIKTQANDTLLPEITNLDTK